MAALFLLRLVAKWYILQVPWWDCWSYLTHTPIVPGAEVAIALGATHSPWVGVAGCGKGKGTEVLAVRGAHVPS